MTEGLQDSAQAVLQGRDLRDDLGTRDKQRPERLAVVTFDRPMRSARGACFLKASAIASGVEATLPRAYRCRR
jgi:hypothetical protein